MSDQIRTIDITPSTEYLQSVRAVLLEQVEKSQKIVKRAQTLYDALQAGDRITPRDTLFIMEALEAYENQEQIRIAHLQEGLEPPSNDEDTHL